MEASDQITHEVSLDDGLQARAAGAFRGSGGERAGLFCGGGGGGGGGAAVGL